MTAGILPAKVQSPTEAGLPTEQMNVTQKVLNAGRRAVHSWKGRGCPSSRANEPCNSWFDTLKDLAWDPRLIEFINRPYTKARLQAVIGAGHKEAHKEAQQWRRTQGEIKKLQREVSS